MIEEKILLDKLKEEKKKKETKSPNKLKFRFLIPLFFLSFPPRDKQNYKTFIITFHKKKTNKIKNNIHGTNKLCSLINTHPNLPS